MKLVKRYPRVVATQRLAQTRSYDGFGGGGFSGLTLSGGRLTGSGTGLGIDAQTALTITAVLNAVSIYANTIGRLDLYVAEKDERGGHPAAYYHPVYDLVHSKPNTRQTSFIFRQTFMVHALTRGNAYAEIIRNGKGRPVAMEQMCPARTEPVLKADGSLWYRTPAKGEPSGWVELPAKDVVHIKTIGWDGIKGLSPIALARRTLGLAVSQETYQASLMDNSATPNGYLKTPGTMKDPEKARLRADFQEMHGGAGKAGNFGILSGGLEWVATSFSPEDTQIILSRAFSIAEIARLFNLPQHMLGQLDKATFSNIEEQNIQFYQLSLTPWLVQIEQELTSKLFGPRERASFSIRHDTGSLLRGNVAAQTAQDKAYFDMGVLSPNQIAVGRGMSPSMSPSADKHFVPANNLVALEDLDKIQPEPVAKLDPDDTTENDPTEVNPQPDDPPTPLPPATNAVRAVLADALGRMQHREIQALKRVAKRSDFAEWIDTYYRSQAGSVAEAIAPGLALLGGGYEPAEVAGRFLAPAREQVRGLVVTTPPDEMPEAVARLCGGWEGARASRFLDDLLGGSDAEA